MSAMPLKVECNSLLLSKSYTPQTLVTESMKTLIIEDDYPQALYLKMLLQDLGYNDITITSNLESIHNATASTQYDLIFTDIRMPEADGITLLSKKLTPNTTRGVVIVSVVDDTIKELTKGMCHQLGYEYTSILSKPFDSEKLSLEIDLFLSHLAESKQTQDEFKPEADDVLSAFRSHSVLPLYQPQFSFNKAELVGVEALARLNHPEHGMLVPSQFLSILSEHNLLLDLYYFMLERSTLDLGTILSPPQLSLNIDTNFLNTEFCEKTVEICQQNGFPLEKLTLEITEHKAFQPTPTVLENLARLNLYGVSFSIDDFGTGYASLNQLIDLPISELKIDRRFVSNVVTNYKHQQLTLAALRLAQALGLSCVAEGIEDQQTWEYLKELGVDICQGFYTGAPMSFLELASLHRAVSGEATSWSKEEQYDTVILFDQLQTRGKAIQKLVAKELSSNPIILASNPSLFIELLNEASNSFVVVDSKSFQSLPDNIRSDISNTVRKRNAVLLVEQGDSSISELVIPTVSSTGDITSTSINLAKYIDSQHNNKKKRNQPKLSQSEQKIAQLLLAGFTNKHICYELDLSPKTVSTFKTRILQKMGVKSIVELARVLNL